MPDPASLTHHAIDLPEANVISAIVIDDATSATDKVRCSTADDPHNAVDDPMTFDPVVRPAGLFYPKKGDTATVVFPEGSDAEPEIVRWKPNAAEPDHAF